MIEVIISKVIDFMSEFLFDIFYNFESTSLMNFAVPVVNISLFIVFIWTLISLFQCESIKVFYLERKRNFIMIGILYLSYFININILEKTDICGTIDSYIYNNNESNIIKLLFLLFLSIFILREISNLLTSILSVFFVSRVLTDNSLESYIPFIADTMINFVFCTVIQSLALSDVSSLNKMIFMVVFYFYFKHISNKIQIIYKRTFTQTESLN